MTIGSVALGLEEDDDLFARPPRREAKAAHITCRVCDRTATVPLDHPALLCPLCLLDLDVTRGRVDEWREKALARLEQVQHVWEAERDGSPAADKWSAIQGALIAVAERRARQEDLDRTWAKRKAEGGPLAALLLAYEAYARAAEQISEELEKLSQAQAQINTAYLALEI
jgi:hypothetical protein